MHLKRYRQETVQQALRAVRDDLGPDALVLSTRLVAAPGPRGWFGGRVVEVTAAADRPGMSDDRQPARPRGRSERAGHEAVARLAAAGLDAGIAEEVVEALPRGDRRAASADRLQRALAERLEPLAANDNGYAPVEVFVGPPGVGKTTTIAKIAARERARRGKRLGLLAADGFRVGAVEQLRLYADILGSPLSVARTPEELEAALDGARRPLLLDTAGRSPSDEISRDMLRVLATRPDVRTHLVLSAETPAAAARRVIERFECARPTRLVISKLDETGSLAPLVALVRERQIPISYLGTGQRVPDDLEVATPSVLAAWVAGEGVGLKAVACV